MHEMQLKASLERSMKDKAAELEQAAETVAAAQAEASAQEELAELAKGELAEYQRRMAAEVDLARREALRSVEGKAGGKSSVCPFDRPYVWRKLIAFWGDCGMLIRGRPHAAVT